jgi:hypothetical protein
MKPLNRLARTRLARVIKPRPIYDLIIGKETMHELGVILDFKEKTIQIDEILLPMRNIMNLQLKPSITRALVVNKCLA